MLFEKIRRTQKPVFIFLGLVFALSFVFLGVGSGAGGISLGNLLGQSSGSSTTSVSDLLNKVHSDPKDATAWRQLGDAYQTSGQTTLALGAYAQYTNLRPKDANTITQVATLYETQAQKQAQNAAYWQSLASQYGTTTSPLPPGGEKLGTSAGAPLVSTAQQPLTQRAQTYQQQAQQSVLQAIALWKKAIALQPDNSTYERASFRAMARALLQSEGYTIVGEAVDGASALTAARELHPEVVLLDVQLPDTDGFAVASVLARGTDPPAIVLTSSRDASDFGPLIAESGARGFVPKGEL